MDISNDTNNNAKKVKAKLVVLADGGRSKLAENLDLEQDSFEYPQSAILSIVNVDRPHRGRAYERFTREGPLALLPHSTKGVQESEQHRYAVVWTTDNDDKESRMDLNDEDFIKALQSSFGDRAGNFSCPSKRISYPLKRIKVEKPCSDRIIIIGNAAHTVHPVAGQGFNLGLRDVASLAEEIYQSTDEHLGNTEMIQRYTNSRMHDTKMVDRFTHSLIEIFSHNSGAISLARNTGLKLVEHLPIAKRLILKRTMGLASKQPRLAMGLALNHNASTKPDCS